MRAIFLTLLCAVLCGCDKHQQKQNVDFKKQVGNPVNQEPADNNSAELATPVIAPKRAALQFGEGSSSTKRNIYVVFDGSGSMNNKLLHGGNQTFKNKIEGAKWAVDEFVKTIPDDINLGLYVFDNHGMRQVLPLAALDRPAFLAAIHEVRAGGGTPLGESIKAGVDALMQKYKEQLGYGEYRLIVVTDGEASGSSITEAVAYAQDYGVPIYTIGLDVSEQHSLRANSRQFFSAKSFEELKKGLIDSAAESETFDEHEFSK